MFGGSGCLLVGEGVVLLLLWAVRGGGDWIGLVLVLDRSWCFDGVGFSG